MSFLEKVDPKVSQAIDLETRGRREKLSLLRQRILSVRRYWKRRALS